MAAIDNCYIHSRDKGKYVLVVNKNDNPVFNIKPGWSLA